MHNTKTLSELIHARLEPSKFGALKLKLQEVYQYAHVPSPLLTLGIPGDLIMETWSYLAKSALQQLGATLSCWSVAQAGHSVAKKAPITCPF